MPNVRTIIIPILFCLFLSSSYAQSYKVQVRLIDEYSLPVKYVGATFIQVEENESKYAMSDSAGYINTNLPEGWYKMNVAQMGKELLNYEFNLESNLDLGVLVVDRSLLLEEIVIEGKKPLVQQKIDRMVFNVENSIVSQGMSGLDAISNAPLIRVDELHGISIVGKSSLTVMVNNRELNLSGTELMNYLRSLRSDDIARVEVITTPPSRFEAAGNSGIINIILKKNPNLGWNGNVSTAYIRNSRNGTRNGVTLNYGGEKLSSSIKLRHYLTGYRLEGTQDFVSQQSNIYSSTLRDDTPSGFGANLSMDYKVNKSSTLGFIYDFSRSTYKIKATNKSIYDTQGVPDSALITNSAQKWLTPTHTLNVYYDVNLDTLGRRLSFVANYLNDNPDKSDDFNTFNSGSDKTAYVRTNNLSGYNIYSLQTDLTIPTTVGTMESGLKYTLFDNSSDIKYKDRIGDEYVLNIRNTSDFDYREQNFAAYISLAGNLSEQLSYNAGFRYEYTKLNGETANVSSVKTHYGKLFPTASLSYKKDDNNVFALNYSRRIGRPGFQALNPFRWYSNPLTYTAGNPFLVPSINNNLRFSYTFRSKFTIELYNQFGDNYYTTIGRLNDGIYSTVWENSYDQNTIGLSFGYYDTFFNRWELAVNANASHKNAKGTIAEFQNVKNTTLYYSFNNTIALDGDKRTNLMINFWHQLPSSFGNIYMEQQFSLSPGFRTSFFNKQLQVNAVLTDVFKSIKNDGERRYVGYSEQFTQYNDNRVLTLALNYTFGNKKVKGSSKNISFEEKSRTY